MFNFKNTEAATATSYMVPGVYALKVTKVELGAFPKGTQYLGVTFADEEGTEFTEKFVISEKALGRLQYLHEGLLGKKCEEDFESAERLRDYFKKFLIKKAVVKNIILGGEISGGKVYAALPYTNFIDEEGNFDLGAFDEDSEEWKKFVKKRTGSGAAATEQTNGLNSTDDDDDAGDDTPPPPPAANKKKGATAAAAPAKKGAAASAPKAAETDEDLDGW
jgi:hypothetical protein